MLGDAPPDWRVSLIDTGIWRNIGGRLMAVKHLVENEEYFLANYSDGLTDASLPDMVERFRKSGKLGCFIAVRPPFSFHLAEFERGQLDQAISFEPGVRHMDKWRLLHLPKRDFRVHAAGGRTVVMSRSIG